MSLHDICLVSNHERFGGRTVVHMAVWAFGNQQNRVVYEGFFNDLCYMAPP